MADGTEINIMPGTIVYADGPLIKPTAKFTLSGTALHKNYTISNPSITNRITRFYHFTSSTSPFSEELSINYHDGNLLNGIPEANLNMFIHNVSDWQYLVGSTVDAVQQLTLRSTHYR